MRSCSFVCAVVLALTVACSHSDTSACSQLSVVGNPPNCVFSAQCTNTNAGYKLDCSAGNGMCVCSQNSVATITVTYEDAYCGDAQDALNAADSACGWKL